MSEITLFSLFLIGLSYGATACMFTCMPFLSPLILTHSKDVKQSLEIMVPFSLGRVFTYSFLAIIASFSASLVKNIINNPNISQIILGSATIIVALFLLRNSLFDKKSCCQTSKKIPRSKFGYFFMGAGISFNPCAPVITLLTASAYTQSITEAFTYGFIFGIGAISASLIFFGIIFSQISKGLISEFSKYKKHIEIFAAFLLILVGIFTLNGSFQL